MKLKVRYDEWCQVITLDEKATDDLWVCLELDADEDISQDEKEQLIQEKWDEKFNKPEYNNMHKFERHKGFCRSMLNEEASNTNYIDPHIDEVRDSTLFFKDELDREKQWDDDDLCANLREVLKPEAAEMVIAIAIKGYSVGEYAASINDTPNNVSHRYRRTLEKLKKLFK